MATGLPIEIDVDNKEWPLWFCNAKKNPRNPRFIWDDPAVIPAAGGAKMGEGITIVHPDTGWTQHPELRKGGRFNIARSKNFLNTEELANDPLTGPFPSHGTSTASVLMSAIGHPNDSPPPPEFPDYFASDFVTGIAPMARVIPCLVSDSVYLVPDAMKALSEAIYCAIHLSEQGQPIGAISISLGSNFDLSSILGKAIEEAVGRGIVIFAAAGQLVRVINNGLLPAFPARHPKVIGVAACDADHNMLDVGFYGVGVDITAPGVEVWRAFSERSATDGTVSFHVARSTGSSYATPFVAGACALWQAHHGRANLIGAYGRSLIPGLFRWALVTSCDTRNHSWNTMNHGAGVIDVEALLKLSLISKSDLIAWMELHKHHKLFP